MSRKVSPEDRALAQKLYAQGLSSRDISAKLENRVSASWVAAKSRAEGWLRGVLPPELISEDTPQVYESSKSTPDEKQNNTAALEAASRRKFVEQKQRLAMRMVGKVDTLLDQMFGEHLITDIKALGVGGGAQEVKIIQVRLPEPSPTDKKNLATTLGILMDKALLLSGDATSRVETAKLSSGEVTDRLQHFRNELAERRAQQAAAPTPKEATG